MLGRISSGLIPSASTGVGVQELDDRRADAGVREQLDAVVVAGYEQHLVHLGGVTLWNWRVLRPNVV